MTGLIIITLGFATLAIGITANALREDFRLVREWRKDHGR